MSARTGGFWGGGVEVPHFGVLEARFFSCHDCLVTSRALPGGLLAIADDLSGNLFCLRAAGGVVFVDHETDESTHVTPSFGAFLDALVPLPEPVPVPPGAVVRVAFNPENAPPGLRAFFRKLARDRGE